MGAEGEKEKRKRNREECKNREHKFATMCINHIMLTVKLNGGYNILTLYGGVF